MRWVKTIRASGLSSNTLRRCLLPNSIASLKSSRTFLPRWAGDMPDGDAVRSSSEAGPTKKQCAFCTNCLDPAANGLYTDNMDTRTHNLCRSELAHAAALGRVRLTNTPRP